MDQSSPFLVRIRGPHALFSRPEFSVERVSYDVITPSAARAVLEAVLFKPAIRWHITRIWLLAPIQYIQFRRNEVNTRLATSSVSGAMRNGVTIPYYADEDRAQRNTVALRDVDYAVEAHFTFTDRKGPSDNMAKFEEMFARRLSRGQQHYQPYLGTREFPAIVEPYLKDPLPIAETRHLGMLLHDIDFKRGNQPVFFAAFLKAGELTVPPWQDVGIGEARV
jgi:CRISPR-associated protein Cas5d